LTLLTRIRAWALVGAVATHWNEPLSGTLLAVVTSPATPWTGAE
jgi:hypothetical protein